MNLSESNLSRNLPYQTPEELAYERRDSFTGEVISTREEFLAELKSLENFDIFDNEYK